jgi:hypothetical protein
MVAVEVVGIEVELALLDPVLHVAARAVDLLVQALGLAFVASERGDHETGIGFSLRPLGLSHDPAPPAPGPARRPLEALEAVLHPAGTSVLGGDQIKLGLDLGDEPLGGRSPWSAKALRAEGRCRGEAPVPGRDFWRNIKVM